MISKEDAVKLQENFDKYVKDILITIVIPCYNHPMYLRRALSSLVAQTCDKFIVTVVDDHSNKDIKRVCERYAGHLLINYVRMAKNVGAGMARQQGIDVCKTPYVTFLDADDTLAPNAVLTWDHLIRDNIKSKDPTIDILVTRFLYEQKADRKSLPYATPVTTDELLKQTEVFRQAATIRNHVYAFEDGFSFLCGKVYRMEYLAKHLVQFFPIRTVEDTCFNTQAFSFDPIIYQDDTITYQWRDTPDGLHSLISYEDQVVATSYAIIPIKRAGRVFHSIALAHMVTMVYNDYYDKHVQTMSAKRRARIEDLLHELVRNLGGMTYISNSFVQEHILSNAKEHELSITDWLKQYADEVSK